MYFSLPDFQHSSFEVKSYLEVRLRFERRIDRDFYSAVDDDRTDSLHRIRPGIEWKSGKRWSGEFQYQLAGDRSWKAGSSMTDRASDLNLGFARYQDSQIDATMGRQKINVGSERLIGSLEWSMTGRAFDGIRLKSGPWDAFAFKVGVAFPKPNRTRIIGATYTSGIGLTSLIYKFDDKTSPVTKHWTLSHLNQKSWGKWSGEFEVALQSGRAGPKSLEAWAIHLASGFAISKATRGYLELNAASGGGDSNSTRTFDNLLPTNHKFYGSMDMQAWRNMEEFVLGFDHRIDSKWNAKGSFHAFALRDARDAWYGAAGLPNQGPNGAYVDPTGASGRDVGREFDLEFVAKHDANVTISGGLGIFVPGRFVKVLNGGRADSQKWLFLMIHTRF